MIAPLCAQQMDMFVCRRHNSPKDLGKTRRVRKARRVARAIETRRAQVGRVARATGTRRARDVYVCVCMCVCV